MRASASDMRADDRKQLDFLDILLTAKDAEGQGLTAQEIQDEVDTFTFEGMEPLLNTSLLLMDYTIS